MSQSTHQPNIWRAEFNLYKFTALQNAGYIAFILLYHDYVELFSPGANVFLATSVLFAAVAIGNVYSVYAGFESDARGHSRGIRKSFDFGVIHGLLLAIMAIPVINLSATVKGSLLFAAALTQAISSAYVNASYHAWFIASVRNLGYQGPLDHFMSRRRLVANLVWLIGGICILLVIPKLIPSLAIRLCIAGVATASLYLYGAVKIRQLMWSRNDMGAFESAAYSKVDIARSCGDSFKHALRIVAADHRVFQASTLWVLTWTLGLVVLYFWKDLVNQAAQEHISVWATVIWFFMIVGRILGNSLAVRLDPNDKSRHKKLVLGAWLAGFPMVLYCIGALWSHQLMPGWALAALAVLLITANRVGQEVVLPFSYSRIHESKVPAITQNRAAVESLLAVFSLAPLLLTWGAVWLFEQDSALKKDIIPLLFGVLGALTVAWMHLSDIFSTTLSSVTGRVVGVKHSEMQTANVAVESTKTQ